MLRGASSAATACSESASDHCVQGGPKMGPQTHDDTHDHLSITDLQGSVATYSKCGGVVNNRIRKGLLLSLRENFF